MLELFDAMHEDGGIAYVGARDERAAGHMADAKASAEVILAASDQIDCAAWRDEFQANFARLCGAKGYRVEKPGELSAALTSALSERVAAVIHVKIDPAALSTLRKDLFTPTDGTARAVWS